MNCRKGENGLTAAHDDPHFLAVSREEALMRRAPDIGDAFDFVGCRIDKGDGVGAVGNCDQRLVIGREAEAVDIDLSFIKRRQDIGPGITQPDLTEQVIGRWIDHRDRVGVLIGRVDPILWLRIG